jgi:DNA invertase Pin-like site-specific DNA recombinase
VRRLLFNVLATVAEFESDLIRLRTREGIKIAKAKGRLRGRRPKLKPKQARTHAGFAELFGVRRSTVNRTIEPSVLGAWRNVTVSLLANGAGVVVDAGAERPVRRPL